MSSPTSQFTCSLMMDPLPSNKYAATANGVNDHSMKGGHRQQGSLDSLEEEDPLMTRHIFFAPIERNTVECHGDCPDANNLRQLVNAKDEGNFTHQRCSRGDNLLTNAWVTSEIEQAPTPLLGQSHRNLPQPTRACTLLQTAQRRSVAASLGSLTNHFPVRSCRNVRNNGNNGSALIQIGSSSDPLMASATSRNFQQIQDFSTPLSFSTDNNNHLSDDVGQATTFPIDSFAHPAHSRNSAPPLLSAENLDRSNSASSRTSIASQGSYASIFSNASSYRSAASVSSSNYAAEPEFAILTPGFEIQIQDTIVHPNHIMSNGSGNFCSNASGGHGDAPNIPSNIERWQFRYLELLRFKQQHGHCVVPLERYEYPPLSHWVKRQRCQYKLKMRGKKSTLTDDRQQLLEEVGFIWDAHEAAWQIRLFQMEDFVKHHGHGNVSSTYPPNQSLAIWAKCQRRQCRFFQEGEQSTLTQARFNDLLKVGFVWDVHADHQQQQQRKKAQHEHGPLPKPSQNEYHPAP